jgi:hypothetical protein
MRSLRVVSGTAAPRRPHLFVNPMSDADFARSTAEYVKGGTRRPEDLADQLRPTYPDVVARKREIEGEAESWYVYRDGHWIDEDLKVS